MKRLLSLLVLLVVLGACYSPFYASAAPTDSKAVNPATGEATLSKWGGSASIKVKPADAVSLVNGKLKTGAGIEVKVEERADAFEYSWILSSRSASNVFSLELTFTGCTYYYQPPLTAEEVAAGNIRPENVVGSYAVYSELKNGIYQTGKVAHIYRPLVTDAAGKTTWGDMKIENGVLSVTVDQKWLDKATYPVIVDPTFGYNTVGASSAFLQLNEIQGSDYATPAESQIYARSISMYVSSGAGAHAKMGIWVAANGGANLALTAVHTNGGGAAAWVTANIVTPYALSASTTYTVAAISDNTFNFYYDAAGGTSHYDGADNYAAPGAFNYTSSGTRRYSIYVTYTYGPTVTSQTINLDDTTNLYAMKQYYSLTVVVNDDDGAADISAVSARLRSGADTSIGIKVTGLTGAPTWTLDVGGSEWLLDTASCTWTENGNEGTAVFKIEARWNVTATADLDISASVLDSASVNSTWSTTASYCDVISRLVTHDFAANMTSTTINVPVAISGLVRYATTTTGNTASSSYPPNAQFIGVAVKDDQGTMVFNDTAIANGAFSGNFNTSNLVRTSFYYAYITMQPPYTPGLAPDGDYVTITTSPDFNILAIVQQGFAYWGTTFATVNTVITAFATWFTQSATAVVDMITGLLTLIFYLAGTITSWVGRMASFFVNLFTFINTIFDGTIGGHNIWTEFNVSAWIDIIPVIAFIIWFGGIPLRARRGGVSELEILVRDLQIASWIIGEVWNWTFTVFNTVVNLVMTFVGTVTG